MPEMNENHDKDINNCYRSEENISYNEALAEQRRERGSQQPFG